MRQPKAKEIWQHSKSGHYYEVVGVAIDAGNSGRGGHVVVYRPLYSVLEVFKMFTRPLDEFLELVMWGPPEARMNGPRFVPVDISKSDAAQAEWMKLVDNPSKAVEVHL